MLFGEYTADGDIVNFQPARREDERFSEPYLAWRERFVKTAPGRDALAKLATLKPWHPDLFDQFQEDMLFACWCAIVYRQHKHKEYKFRHLHMVAEHKQAVEIAATLVRAGELLRAPICEEMNIEIPLNSLLNANSNFEKGASPSALADFLDAAAREFDPGSVLQTQMERTRIACLEYGQTVKGNKTPSDDGTDLGLAYETTLRIRYFTADRNPAPLDIGDGRIQPGVGLARYDVVASLVKATLQGKKLPSSDAGKDEIERIENRIGQFRYEYPKSRWADWCLDINALPDSADIAPKLV